MLRQGFPLFVTRKQLGMATLPPCLLPGISESSKETKINANLSDCRSNAQTRCEANLRSNEKA